MPSRDDVLTRVDAELIAGRPWRAKEIIRGTIAGGRTEPAILECYGRLLERLGERVEAGKYLFLSGVRKPEYAESIALFKARHGKRKGKDLISQFPTEIRRQEFDALPPILQHELAAMGVAADLFGPRSATVGPMSWSNRIGAVWAILIAVVFMSALVVGLATIASWLWDLLNT